MAPALSRRCGARRAALALAAAALCIGRALGGAVLAGSAGAGLLASSLDAAVRPDLNAVAAGNGTRGASPGAGAPPAGPLATALAAALAAAGVDPGARLHAVHADATELDFLRNWARHARVQRIPNLALLALDAPAAAAGARLGLTTFDVPTLLAAAGGPASLSAALARRSGLVTLLQALLSLGHDVLLSEPDVWLRDPALYLAVYDMAAADVLVGSECLHHFLAREGPDPVSRASRQPLDAPLSLSVLVLKPTAATAALLAEWGAALGAAPGVGALEAFTGALLPPPALPPPVPTLQPVPGGSWRAAREQDLFPRYPPRVNDGTQAAPYWAGRNGSVGLGVLPVGLFTNGHTFFTADLPALYRLKPYTARGGAAARGAPAARARLREARLWADAPPHYAHAALLALNLAVPAPLAAQTAPPTAAAHAKLLSWQLARVAEAFALARAAKRALVLPRLLCSCDPDAISGCIAGEVTLPFRCALDTAVNVSALDASGWEYRESSFLEHPRFVASAADDAHAAAAGGDAPPVPRTVLRLCTPAPGSPGAQSAAAAAAADGVPPLLPCGAAPPDAGGAAPLPAGSTVAAAAAALEAHAAARVVQIDVFGPGLVSGFGTPAEADAFNAQMAKISLYPLPPLPHVAAAGR